MANDQKLDIDLGLHRREYRDGREQNAVLTIKTGKSFRGGLSSTATVFWLSEHSRSHAFGVGGGGDFSETIEQSQTAVRATQSAIDKQHSRVFTDEVIATLTAKAKAYYATAEVSE